MRETKNIIDARKRLEREKEKEEKEKKSIKPKKTRDYLWQNLFILNELAYLVHENTDKSFYEIFNEFIKERIENEEA